MGIISGYNGARRYSQPSSVTKIFTDEVTVGTTSSNQGLLSGITPDIGALESGGKCGGNFHWSESSWSHEWIQTQCQ